MTDINDLLVRIDSLLKKYSKVVGEVKITRANVIKNYTKEVAVTVTLACFLGDTPLETQKGSVAGSVDRDDDEYKDFENIFIQNVINWVENMVKKQKIKYIFERKNNTFTIRSSK